jgi:hypothetical protein
MKPVGPSSTNPNLADGGPSVFSTGVINTGITINQAWRAGGFSFGFTGQWNTKQEYSYAEGTIVSAGASLNGSTLFNNGQGCFDGTLYWAIRRDYLAGTYVLANSPDLINWTVAAVQPPVAVTKEQSLSSPSPGMIALVHTVPDTSNNQVSPTVYYWSGTSWTATKVDTSVPSSTAGAGTQVFGYVAATGNATYPHVMYYGYNTTNSNGLTVLMVGNLTTGMTRVATLGGSGAGWTNAVCQIKVIDGVICVLPGRIYQAVALWTARVTDAINTTAAWSATLITTGNTALTDVDYHRASGQWVFSGIGGVYTSPAAGGAGSAIAPVGVPATNVLSGFSAPTAIATTVRTNVVSTTNIRVVNNVVYAFAGGMNGSSTAARGSILVSTDGVTYTPIQKIIPTGLHPISNQCYDWRCVIWTGTQYVMFTAGTGTSGVNVHANFVITSPDLSGNFETKYISDTAEIVPGTNYGCTGLTFATGAPNNGVYTLVSNTPFLGFYSSGPTTANPPTRNVGLVSSTSGWYFGSGITVPATGLISVEWVAKATANSNQFTVDLYLNGIKQFTGSPITIGQSSGDTTSLILIQFERFARLTSFDDVTFTLLDGQGLQGPLGAINIIAERPSIDVQAQWIPTETGSNANANSVRQPAMSSTSSKFVSSATTGDTDIYGTTDVIPAGYTAKAMVLEGYITQTSTTSAQVELGIKSGSTTSGKTVTTVTQNTPIFVSQVFDKDPATGAAWTATAIQNSQFSLKHIA